MLLSKKITAHESEQLAGDGETGVATNADLLQDRLIAAGHRADDLTEPTRRFGLSLPDDLTRSLVGPDVLHSVHGDLERELVGRGLSPFSLYDEHHTRWGQISHQQRHHPNRELDRDHRHLQNTVREPQGQGYRIHPKALFVNLNLKVFSHRKAG